LDKPFDNNLFNEYINGNGAKKTGEDFRNMVENDMKVFKNPISRSETSDKIEQWIRQIAEPTKKVKESFAHFNNHNQYKISCADFEIDGNTVTLNEGRLKQHFTVFANESQDLVYRQFQKLADTYNETINFLKASGFKFGGRPLVDMFQGRSMIDPNNSQIFKFEIAGKLWNQDDRLGAHIMVDKKILTLFK
jgi:hypothetical protein